MVANLAEIGSSGCNIRGFSSIVMLIVRGIKAIEALVITHEQEEQPPLERHAENLKVNTERRNIAFISNIRKVEMKYDVSKKMIEKLDTYPASACRLYASTQTPSATQTLINVNPFGVKQSAPLALLQSSHFVLSKSTQSNTLRLFNPSPNGTPPLVAVR